MASNYLSLQPLIVSAKQTIPASANGTGTIITQGTGVVGTGTAFRTEMPRGSYLYIASANELRQVTRVDSDTTAWLSQAFTANVGSSTPVIIHAKKCKAKEYIFTARVADGTMVDNTGTMVVSFVTNVPKSISKQGNSRSSIRDVLPPTIVAPGSDGTIDVNINY